MSSHYMNELEWGWPDGTKVCKESPLSGALEAPL